MHQRTHNRCHKGITDGVGGIWMKGLCRAERGGDNWAKGRHTSHSAQNGLFLCRPVSSRVFFGHHRCLGEMSRHNSGWLHCELFLLNSPLSHMAPRTSATEFHQINSTHITNQMHLSLLCVWYNEMQSLWYFDCIGFACFCLVYAAVILSNAFLFNIHF